MSDDAPRPYSDDEIAERGAKFDVIMPLIEAMYEEISALSKKKPDALANKHKITAANRLLTDALWVLEREPSRTYLEAFDADSMPQYSDMVLTLGQFQAAMHAFRKRYYNSSQYNGPVGWLPDVEGEEDEALTDGDDE